MQNIFGKFNILVSSRRWITSAIRKLCLIETSFIPSNYFREYLDMSTDASELKRFVQSVIGGDTSSPEVSEILNAFEFMVLEKNEFFVVEGTVCQYFCYIQKGILQHHISVDGNEKTTYLGLKNSCTAALESFRNKIPARKSIRALSDCELWVLKLDEFNRLMLENSTFYRFYHNLIEQQIYKIDDYRIDLITLSPEERYQKLLDNEPLLLRDVPLHYLASFLGISTRHMSRIRKNIK